MSIMHLYSNGSNDIHRQPYVIRQNDDVMTVETERWTNDMR